MADENGNSFMWFLAGLGLGAAIGILYAPKAGRETREDIRQCAEDGRDFVVNRVRQTRDQAQQWVEKGRQVLEQQKEQIRSAFDAGKEAYRDVTSEQS
jgi:gas vesicle protein